MLAVALLLSTSAFAPNAPVPTASPGCARHSAPCASLSSRRSALSAASVAALGLASVPLTISRPAYADLARTETTDDAIERITAKNRAAQEAERAKAKAKISKNAAKVERENAGSNAIVGTIAAASFVFSLPFFYKNLGRLLMRYKSVVDDTSASAIAKQAQAGQTRRGESRRSER